MRKRASLLLALILLTVFSAPGRMRAQPLTSNSDISAVDSGLRESTFGNLAADALRSETGAEIALVPSSAFHPVTIPAAGMDSSSITSVLVVTDSPSDAFAVRKLTGSEVLAALERSVSRLPQSYGGFLQVSGIKVNYSPSKDPGQRIVAVTLSNGAALSPNTTYSVAMTVPLADGDMGYFQVWGDDSAVKPQSKAFSSIIASYAIAHQPLNIRTDGRLTSL